jgi:hypothetical protein
VVAGFVGAVWAGSEVEFSIQGLGAGSGGDSAVCGVAVAELVSREGVEAGSLEGQGTGSSRQAVARSRENARSEEEAGQEAIGEERLAKDF